MVKSIPCKEVYECCNFEIFKYKFVDIYFFIVV